MARWGEWDDERRGGWDDWRARRAEERAGWRGETWREPWRAESPRDEWRGEPRDETWRRDWRTSERAPWEHGYGEREPAWWRERERQRSGGHAGERWEGRREIDPPWVEQGPEARRYGDTRGLVEWEDRGPLAWLGDKFREATGKPARGPKGYRRSDERICDDVCERISRSGVDAHDVEVKVENGEVTLTGTVPSRAQKWRLEEVADDAYGVEDVHNQVRVARTEPEDERALEARARRPGDVRH